jgi:hypothetical protein
MLVFSLVRQLQIQNESYHGLSKEKRAASVYKMALFYLTHGVSSGFPSRNHFSANHFQMFIALKASQ